MFYVRQKLCDFLHVAWEDASRGLPNESYWIDALTIDQFNISERNHQVTQMGQIFNQAICVHMWLGTLPAAVPVGLFRPMRSGEKRISLQEWKTFFDNKHVISKLIFNNDYFNRTWMTQEVLLARHAVIRLGNELITLEQTIAGLQRFGLDKHHLELKHSPFLPFMEFRREDFAGMNLILVLKQFYGKKCENPRDRIYSLLSLCSHQGRGIDVDYGTPVLEVAINVLRECHRSFCLCSIVMLLVALGMREKGATDAYLDDADKLVVELDLCTETKQPDAMTALRRDSTVTVQDVRTLEGTIPMNKACT